VVHNGIIENFQELREELEAEGCRFETETDTEIVAHLLHRQLEQQKTPQQAMEYAMTRLQGAFALAVIVAGRSDLMLGARRGSPLAVGFGDGEMFLGSDALALSSLTRNLCYLEEEDWVALSPSGAEIWNNGRRVERPLYRTALTGAAVGKGNYAHFMLKEIHEQPSVIGDTLQAFVNTLAHK